MWNAIKYFPPFTKRVIYFATLKPLCEIASSYKLLNFYLNQHALSFASNSSCFRLSKALNKSIIITPTFDPLLSLIFQDSIILKKEFCVL